MTDISTKYFDFSENKTVKEVVFCCLAMIPTQSTIFFSDVIPKKRFSSHTTMANFQGQVFLKNLNLLGNAILHTYNVIKKICID